MLGFFRKYSGSTGVKALYAVLALLFVIWGVGAVGGQRVDVVARVHGQPITRHEVERATAAMQRRYEAMFKGKMALPANLDLRRHQLPLRPKTGTPAASTRTVPIPVISTTRR